MKMIVFSQYLGMKVIQSKQQQERSNQYSSEKTGKTHVWKNEIENLHNYNSENSFSQSIISGLFP